MDERPQPKGEVPKFSSFQPKKSKAEKEKRPKRPRSPEDRPERSTHSLRSEKSSKRSDEKHTSRHHHSRSEKARTERSLTVRSSHENPRDKAKDRRVSSVSTTEQSWISDRQGDPLNERYLSLHKHDISPYRRVGYGRVLGTADGIKINRDESTDKKLVLNLPAGYDYPARSVLSTQGKNISKHPKLVLTPVSSNITQGETPQFISLNPSRKRKRLSANVTQGVSHTLLLERPNDDVTSSSEEESESEEDYVESYVDQEDISTRQRNAQLIKISKEQPHDLETWRELIKHQDKMMLLGQVREDVELGSAAKQSLADIKISIYKEAIAKLTGNDLAQEELWLGMLAEAQDLWEGRVLLQHWKTAVESLPRSFQIRIGYVNYLQTSHSAFRFEQCKQEYLKLLKMLKHEHEASREPGQPTKLEAHQTYVFLRLTVFLKQAGYHELSLALWQSVLDLVITVYEDSASDRRLSTFEEYWDSECYRLGEKPQASQIWFHSGNREQPEPVSYQTQTVSPGRDIFAKFAKAEMAAESALYLPGRTIDDAGEDDPFHVILYSDLEPILSTLLLGHTNKHLIHAFLCYAGLLPPLHEKKVKLYSEFWSDPFLRTYGVDLWQTSTESTDSTFPLVWTSQRTTTDLLFRGVSSRNPALSTEWLQTVQTIVHDTVESEHNWPELAEYVVALSLKYCNVEEAARVGKKLLKGRRACLRLYNAYALMEKKNGNLKTSHKVFTKAINMADTLGAEHNTDLILLWHTWIWETLHDEDLATAIHLLLSLAEEKVEVPQDQSKLKQSFRASNVLKITQKLKDGQNNDYFAGSYHQAALHADLLATFTYFQHEESLPHAIESFQESLGISLEVSAPNNIFEELIHQSRTILITYHTKNHPYRPKDVQILLSESLRLFPNNTLILTAYSDHERSFGLNDRARSFLADMKNSGAPTAIIHWLFTLWSEHQRLPELGGTTHATRAILDRAVESNEGRYSLALWTTYLYFEKAKGDTKSLMKTVHRGLSRLPWSKSFVTQSLQLLADRDVSHLDLKSLYQVLEDRELRVHINIIEELEETEARRQGRR